MVAEQKVQYCREIKAYNSPFCIRGAVIGFLKIPLSLEDYNRKKNREKSLIPFLLQPSLSFSYLLQKNYLERPQRVETMNKKKKENGTEKKTEGNL